MTSIKDKLQMFESQPHLFRKPNNEGFVQKPISEIQIDVDDYDDEDLNEVVQFAGSNYDLPGLENFIIENNKKKLEVEEIECTKLVDELTKNEFWNDTDSLDSKEPEVIAEQIKLSLHREKHFDRKSQRRSLFSSIFKSKRKKRPNPSKTDNNDIYDSDDVSDSTTDKKSKCSSNHNITDSDSVKTDNADKPTKPPLNNFFNRDWLNSLGDGVKKKSSVMSELRKVFSHGFFMSSKKKFNISKPEKSSKKGKQPMNLNKKNQEKGLELKASEEEEEDIYDIDDDDSHDNDDEDVINFPSDSKNIYEGSESEIIEEVNEVYDEDDDNDDDDDDDVDDDEVEIYDDENSDELLSNKDNQIIHEYDEEVYDNEEENNEEEELYDDEDEDEDEDDDETKFNLSNKKCVEFSENNNTIEKDNVKNIKIKWVSLNKTNKNAEVDDIYDIDEEDVVGTFHENLKRNNNNNNSSNNNKSKNNKSNILVKKSDKKSTILQDLYDNDEEKDDKEEVTKKTKRIDIDSVYDDDDDDDDDDDEEDSDSGGNGADDDLEDEEEAGGVKNRKVVTDKSSIVIKKASFTEKLSAEIKRRQKIVKENMKTLTSDNKTKPVERNKKDIRSEMEDYDYDLGLEETMAEEEYADLQKIIKKNMEKSSKLFKFSLPVTPISRIQAITPMLPKNRLDLECHQGELLDVINFRENSKDGLILVKNSIGRCGLVRSKYTRVISEIL